MVARPRPDYVQTFGVPFGFWAAYLYVGVYECVRSVLVRVLALRWHVSRRVEYTVVGQTK